MNITDEDIIEAAFQHYRKVGFPYPDIPYYEKLFLFRKLQETKSRITVQKPGLLDLGSRIIEIQKIHDQVLCNTFHPHIYRSHAEGMKNPVQSFAVDTALKKAIRLALKYEFHLNNTTLLQMLRFVNGTQMCSNFRPTVAKAVYEYIGGKDVLDMCTGYGGRLLGFLASSLTGHYIGADPSRLTYEGNIQIAQTFQAEKRVTLILDAFEDAPLDKLDKVDIAFTSPPYFAKEIYDDNPKENKKQSRERYKDYESWKSGFLQILIEKTVKLLRPKGTMALNVADVTIKGERYPIIEDTIQIAKKTGWPLSDRLSMSFATFGRGLKKQKEEPILLFQKNK